MSKLEFRLKEWGAFRTKHLDFADEYGENILARCAEYGYTDPTTGQVKTDLDGESLGRDAVLCPDTPRRIQKVDIAVNSLPHLQRSALFCAYCAPLREDGNLFTVGQFSRMLRINKGKFRAELRKGRRKLLGLLTGV